MKPNRLITLIGLALLLPACASQSGQAPTPPAAELAQTPAATDIPVDTSIAMVDDMGRSVTLAGPPQRIVSTAASITEILFAIGAGDLVVGRDDFSVYPDAAQRIPSYGTLWGDFPAEAILGMQPDLVLAAEILSADQVQAFEDLGLAVYWQANPVTFDDLYENILEIAVLTGHTEQAETLVAGLRGRVDSVIETVAAVETRPLVFYELDATDPNNPWTAGAGTFVDNIITTAGGINAAATLEGDFAQFSLEALLTQNPDVIILGDADFGVTPEQVAARGGWGQTTAALNGAIFPIDSNWMSVPGPRLVDGLEAVARMLHPELFE
ncbi:MAG: ABC transporter substrate-binding protein [Chloroflexi bacterium]|nr:ABC transporter substrate-binding protein [Chloroflexota bacterium]